MVFFCQCLMKCVQNAQSHFYSFKILIVQYKSSYLSPVIRAVQRCPLHLPNAINML